MTSWQDITREQLEQLDKETRISSMGHWSDWLGGLGITHDKHGNSLLTGVVPDQAALHGILAQIRDLGLTIISLTSQII